MKMNFFRVSALAAAMVVANGAMAVTATFPGAPVGAIPDNGVLATAASAAGPAATTNVTDVNLTVNINHTWTDDIDITLASTNPVAAATTIINDCGSNGDYQGGDLVFDDAAAGTLACATAGIMIPAGTIQSPNGPTVMAAFNGSATAAPMAWNLTVADDSAICTGTLNSWSVTVTSDAPVPVELSNFSVD
jgi:subtilisin-like proprotein convertase family protein